MNFNQNLLENALNMLGQLLQDRKEHHVVVAIGCCR